MAHNDPRRLSVVADAARPPIEIEAIASALSQARREWRATHGREAEGLRGVNFPSRGEIETLTADLISSLFPFRLGPPDLLPEVEEGYVRRALREGLASLLRQLRLELAHRRGAKTLASESDALGILNDFANELPHLRRALDLDVEAAYRGDPSAQSVDEALLCSPGVLAVIHHRIAHSLHRAGSTLVARVISEIGHARTGVDIHPGAKIGRRFFIDHGSGVVIGETAEIGDDVRIYQGVTLGALSFAQDGAGALVKGEPRHPIIQDRVVIYTGATILGRVTIGADSTIGGGVWLTRSVPARSFLTQARPTSNVEASER
jgi:serine O-acetyltransferase